MDGETVRFSWVKYEGLLTYLYDLHGGLKCCEHINRQTKVVFRSLGAENRFVYSDCGCIWRLHLLLSDWRMASHARHMQTIWNLVYKTVIDIYVWPTVLQHNILVLYKWGQETNLRQRQYKHSPSPNGDFPPTITPTVSNPLDSPQRNTRQQRHSIPAPYWWRIQ